jgi:hypothetical protein
MQGETQRHDSGSSPSSSFKSKRRNLGFETMFGARNVISGFIGRRGGSGAKEGMCGVM